MRSLQLFVGVIVLCTGACGGGDGGATPPPPDAGRADANRPRDTGAVLTGGDAAPPVELDAAVTTDAGMLADGGPRAADAAPATSDAGPLPAGVLAVAERVDPGVSFTFAVGPVWLKNRALFLFSDTTTDKLHTLTPAGTLAVFREPAGKPVGNSVDGMGRVYTCEEGRVSRTDASGTVTPFVMRGCNDVVVRADGSVYLAEFSGGRVTRVSPDGTASAIDMNATLPNGLALSPDGRTLYATFSNAQIVKRYPLAADGSAMGAGTMFADVRPLSLGNLGSIAADDEGNVYVAGGSDIPVYAADGSSRGKITVGVRTTGLTFGDADRKTLFITTRTRLYRARLSVTGPPH